MNLYRLFLAAFILSIISLIIFLTLYIPTFLMFFQDIRASEHNNIDPDPFFLFNRLFTPPVILSAIILGFSHLLYRILGIVFIARNPKVQSGEKVLWILGFIFLSFITAIVFIALKNSKNLLATESDLTNKDFLQNRPVL